MDLLLDTHTLVWFITNDDNLSLSLKSKISDSANGCYVSIASIWEIVIKHSLGKLELKLEPYQILEILKENDITLLNIEPSHIFEVGALPLHHRDPFDRMLIAQARVENLIIASRDRVFTEYAVNSIWGN